LIDTYLPVISPLNYVQGYTKGAYTLYANHGTVPVAKINVYTNKMKDLIKEESFI
jgi:hypothetical protein